MQPIDTRADDGLPGTQTTARGGVASHPPSVGRAEQPARPNPEPKPVESIGEPEPIWPRLPPGPVRKAKTAKPTKAAKPKPEPEPKPKKVVHLTLVTLSAEDVSNPEVEKLRENVKHDINGRPKGATIGRRYLTKREKKIREILDASDEEFPNMPATRAGCANVPRPCPYVGCSKNLYLDPGDKDGIIKIHDPSIEPHEMKPDRSCVLDIADANPDGLTLDACGEAMNITRERLCQVEVMALEKANANYPD